MLKAFPLRLGLDEDVQVTPALFIVVLEALNNAYGKKKKEKKTLKLK